MAIKRRIAELEKRVSCDDHTKAELKDESEIIAEAERRAAEMFKQARDQVKQS